MLLMKCSYCGDHANRLDGTTWHCPSCGTLLFNKGNGIVIGVPAWALWIGWLVHPIRRFNLWWTNPR